MPRLLAPLLLALLPALAQAEDLIRVYNWNDYIAPEVLEEFQKETGIKVEYHTFSSAEELNKALAGGEPIDVAVPSHNDLPRLIKAGRLQPLEDRNIAARRLQRDAQMALAQPFYAMRRVRGCPLIATKATSTSTCSRVSRATSGAATALVRSSSTNRACLTA